MQNEEFLSISQNERTHWWYHTLHHLTRLHMTQHDLGKDATILDAACGTGGLVMYLQEEGYTQVRGFDQSDIAVKIAHSRELPVVKGDLRAIKDAFPGSRFDVIVCHDAFYFLDEKEQKQFLKDSAGILNRGGLLLMNIPALIAFSGPHDRVVGIRHRMNRSQLKRLTDPLLFDWQSSSYWPFLLSPLILFIRWVQRIKTVWNEASVPRSDLKKEAGWLNWILKSITAFEIRYIHRTFFGSSLFLVLKAK